MTIDDEIHMIRIILKNVPLPWKSKKPVPHFVFQSSKNSYYEMMNMNKINVHLFVKRIHPLIHKFQILFKAVIGNFMHS